jgi:putative hydrolase of the HAD superfamily
LSATIAHVLFDLGDVLCEYVPERRMAEWSRLSGLAPEEIHRRLRGAGFHERCDRGIYDGTQMLAELNRGLELALTRREAQRLEMLAFEPRAEVIAVARDVAERFPTGVLSNNAVLLDEILTEAVPELGQIFDPILFSYQFGHTKPAPELFEGVAARLDVQDGDLLLIDDSARNVEAAHQAGWQAIRFETCAELIRELKARGVLSTPSAAEF